MQKRVLPQLTLVVLGVSSLLFGQSERGTISGAVRDASGAIVQGAQVHVTNPATNENYELSSNEAGEFTLPSLPAGTYNLRVEKPGFRTAALTGITVNAATTSRADVTLEVGQAQQTVEVQANAVQLATEDAKTSVTVNNKLVNDLPLVVAGAVRSPFDLAAITPESKNLGGDA